MRLPYIILLPLSCLLVGISFVEMAGAQELRELSIQRFDEVPEMPTVMADYPERAYLVFLSPITNLQFETNWVIFDNLSEPEEGRYILVVDTVRQVLRISVPDQFRATDLNIPKLLARQTLYYTIEPANTRQLDLARQEYEQGTFESAVSRLNSYILIDNLTATQRARAYQLSALCFYEMNEPDKMRQALYRLLQVDPHYLPDVIANPAEVNVFVTAYRDSVYQAVPSRPQVINGVFREGAVMLTWTRNAEHDIKQYNIYRGQRAGADIRLLQIVDAEIDQFVDYDVEPFETYDYYLTATDTYAPAQEGPSSRTITVTTLPPLIERMTTWDEESAAVQNVSVQALSDSVFSIVYDLAGALRRTYDVSIALSNNGGESFSLIPNATTGDVGENVQDGPRRQITWNVLTDFPAGLSDRNYHLKIEAEPQPFSEQIRLIADPDSLVSQLALESKGDGLLSIVYTLREERRRKYLVDLIFSREANSTYGISPRAIEGDWGKHKKGGSVYTITWRLLEDFPNGLGEEITLKLMPAIEPGGRRNVWIWASGGAALMGGGAWLLLNGTDKPVVASSPPGRP